MLPKGIPGSASARIQGLSGTVYPEQSRRNSHAHTYSEAPVRPVRSDGLQISPDAMRLNRLLRLWGALGSLFGTWEPQQRQGPDLASLRQALLEAQERAREMQERQGVLNTLKTSALQQAEALVARYYGLQGDGARLRVVLEEDMGGVLASVSYQYDRQGRMANQQLNLSMKHFTPDTGPNGRNAGLENDRIIAHELTHAIMGRNIDFRTLPDWFVEGTAEYIAGGMERVSLMLERLSSRQLMARLRQPWGGDSAQYAAGYIAVRYLDTVTAEGGGLRGIIQSLKAGDSLDQAITRVSGGTLAGVDGFFEHLIEGGAGAAFLRSIDTSGRDPGSIRPASGPDVVPDHGARSNQPLRGFRVEWPSPLEGLGPAGMPGWYGISPARTAAAAYRRYMVHDS